MHLIDKNTEKLDTGYINSLLYNNKICIKTLPTNSKYSSNYLDSNYIFNIKNHKGFYSTYSLNSRHMKVGYNPLYEQLIYPYTKPDTSAYKFPWNRILIDPYMSGKRSERRRGGEEQE